MIIRYLVLPVLAAAALVPPLQAQSPPAEEEDELLISTVLNEIQKGLLESSRLIEDEQLPPLKSVVLTLQTEHKRSAGGGIKILIFSFGKTWERTKSHQLVLTLKPPKAGDEQPVSLSELLSEQLVNAIVTSAKGISAAARAQPPLELTDLKAEFKFVVQSGKKGSGTFSVLPVGVDLKGDLSKKAVHSVVVQFGA